MPGVCSGLSGKGKGNDLEQAGQVLLGVTWSYLVTGPDAEALV